VFAEDKLFATLDTTVRKVVIQNLPFLLTDTVGFIRKLPTQLVESFKSTLDEVREADLLLHVVDIAHESFEDHIAAVQKILEEIKASDKPVIMVFNKIDAYKPKELHEDENIVENVTDSYTLEDWRNTWMSKMGNDVIFISATEKENMDDFRKLVYEKVREIHVQRFPYNSLLYPDWNDEEE
jgi:GTP-binding protein HflX